MISVDRVKLAYANYFTTQEVAQTDLFSDLEVVAVDRVFKSQRYITEKLAEKTFEALTNCYENGCRTKEDYLSRLPAPEGDDVEKRAGVLAEKVFKAVLNGGDIESVVRLHIFEHFNEIFDKEGFLETREATDVRRRH